LKQSIKIYRLLSEKLVWKFEIVSIICANLMFFDFDISMSHSSLIIIKQHTQSFLEIDMKVKLMPILAGVVMLGVAVAPLSAQACSGSKNTNSSSGNPTQPSTLPQT
jgi:hypothetical protein